MEDSRHSARRVHPGAAIIADQDASFRNILRQAIGDGHLSMSECASAQDVEAALREPGLRLTIIGDLGESPERMIALLHRVRVAAPATCLIVAPAEGSEALAVESLRLGAADYLNRPLDALRLRSSIERAMNGCSQPGTTDGLERLIGSTELMRQLRAVTACAACVDSNVLIQGETGTGKELVAELIHENSGRAEKPFVCVNCAAIPEALIESELFGHERGAFTGAFSASDGKLVVASGGTVFLDEIGDLAPAAQAKLLRAIEGKQVYRLGARTPVQLDIRIIAATNRDLEAEVAAGRFRADLYYRLNVLCIDTPSLREHKEDLPALVHHFLAMFNRQFGARVRGLSAASFELLSRHLFPGNVRELRNLMEASFVHMARRDSEWLELPPPIRERLERLPDAEESERQRLVRALTVTGWNRSQAAENLRWSRMTVYRKIKQYGLTQEKVERSEPATETPPAMRRAAAS